MISARDAAGEAAWELVTFRVADHWFGVRVAHVQEVLPARAVAPVPLAPADVAGVLNLRGQIVTAIDLRVHLALAADPDPSRPAMQIVMRDDRELFSFLADEVGDVLTVDAAEVEPPRVDDARWHAVAHGLVCRPDMLLTLLDPLAVVADALVDS